MTEKDEKRPQFGTRYLTDATKVFEHNAWDDVEWDEEIEEDAKAKIKINSDITLSAEQIEKYENEAGQFWHAFYCQHQNKFFKDRNWLFTEFQELAPAGYSGPKKNVQDEKKTLISNGEPGDENEAKTNVDSNLSEQNEPDTKEIKIFEVGCGVGNTVFPILQSNINPNLFIYCCDFAESAIELVKEHKLYDTSRCHAFVCDAAGENPEFPFSPNSLDFVVLIFVLSAIHPDRMLLTLKRLSALLKPGGMLLFRDYGRYDMAQLRFKPGRCLSENFYVRGDGTRCYFFTQDEIDDMLVKSGLVKVQNIIDRRLQVNRGRQIKMYRVWVQCKYQKPLN